MSVAIETTLGTITVDLYLSTRPRACINFLKLCKIKYYNFNLFHTISRGFIAQTGDPTGSRSGGESIYGVIDGPEKRYFESENEPRIKHTKMGLISFVGNEEHMIGSQFFITLGDDLIYLDDQHCVFGEVVEGFDILEVVNEVICDTDNRPYQDVRITHTVVLDDPFADPSNLKIPARSPSPSSERLQGGRIAPDEDVDETEGKTVEEVTEMQAEREAKARATILEMVGDIPDADMAPPENVLFVCKLNPVTTDDDLEVIFNRFGKIKSCEVIRDRKTGDSLQYAFIEFEDQKSCEDAYFKMDNILIDDRRIHVDFSQSVSKIKWLGKGRGVKHYDERGKVSNREDRNIGKGNYKQKQYYKNDRDLNQSSDKRDKGRYSPRKINNNSGQNRRSRSRSRSKNYRDRNQSPNKKENSRYSPYRRKDHREQSRHSRSRSRSNSIRNSDRSRASYSKNESTKHHSVRNSSNNEKRYFNRNDDRHRKSISRDRNSSKLYEKENDHEKYNSKYKNRRRDREGRNSRAERSTLSVHGEEKSSKYSSKLDVSTKLKKNRKLRSSSSESRKVKTYHGKSERYPSSSKIRSNSEKKCKSNQQSSSSGSSISDSEDDKKLTHSLKNKVRYDEIKTNNSPKLPKSKRRAASTSSSNDSELDIKGRRKQNKSRADPHKEKRKAKCTDSDKAKYKKKSKSYESNSSSSSESDQPKYKKKSKSRKSSSSSSSDSDSESEPKRNKKVKRKRKPSNDSE